MATINVYSLSNGGLAFIAGDKVDEAPSLGVTPKPEASRDDVIAEVKGALEDLGGLLFVLDGGKLSVEKLDALEPVFVESFEADNIDLAAFADA